MSTWGLSEWGDIANIVIAVASVATAIVTAVVLCKQYRLQKSQLNAQRLEHQPILHFERRSGILTLVNSGDAMAKPPFVKVYPMIIIYSRRIKQNSEEYVYCYPINYYKSRFNTGRVSKEVYSITYNENDFQRLSEDILKFYNDLLCFKGMGDDTPLTYIDPPILANVAFIRYTDMYGQEHNVYKCNNQDITERRFNQLRKIQNRVPVGLYNDVTKIDYNAIAYLIHHTNYKLEN